MADENNDQGIEETKSDRERSFSRRALIRAGWTVPVVMAIAEHLYACSFLKALLLAGQALAALVGVVACVKADLHALGLQHLEELCR